MYWLPCLRIILLNYCMYNLYIRQTVVFFIGITLSLFISCLFYWFEPYVSTKYEEMRKQLQWIVQQYKELVLFLPQMFHRPTILDVRYVMPLKIQLSRREGWDPLSQFNPATLLCLSQAWTWISNCGIVDNHLLNFLFIIEFLWFNCI